MNIYTSGNGGQKTAVSSATMFVTHIKVEKLCQ
jgi:hypothetical protein